MAQHTTIISRFQSLTLKPQELSGYNPLLGDKIEVMEHLSLKNVKSACCPF